MPVQQNFIEQASPFRAELIAHCFDVESPDVVHPMRTTQHGRQRGDAHAAYFP